MKTCKDCEHFLLDNISKKGEGVCDFPTPMVCHGYGVNYTTHSDKDCTKCDTFKRKESTCDDSCSV